MRKGATVWLVQETWRLNVLPARDFGELRTILPARFNLMVDADDAIRQIRERTAEFRRDDYLLLCGDPAAQALTFWVLSQRFPIVTLLKWDRQEQRYYPVTVRLPQVREAA